MRITPSERSVTVFDIETWRKCPGDARGVIREPPHETPYNELLKRRRDHDYSGEEAL
jgi:hypothetical protein